MNLSSNVKVTVASATTAVGTTSVVGSTIDMSGFDGVMFILLLGAFTDGTPGVKASSGAASNGSDKQDLLGALASVGVTGEAAILDVYRPTDRYVTPTVLRGGSTGAVIAGLVAIQYMAGFKPTTQDATVAATTLAISPAYGAA